MKLLWPQNEVMITMLLAYLMTGSEKYSQRLPSLRCKHDINRQSQFVRMAISFATERMVLH